MSTAAEIVLGLAVNGLSAALGRVGGALKRDISNRNSPQLRERYAEQLRAELLAACDLPKIAQIEEDWLKAYLMGPTLPLLLEHLLYAEVSGRRSEFSAVLREELACGLDQYHDDVTVEVVDQLMLALTRYISFVVEDTFGDARPKLEQEKLLERQLANIATLTAALGRPHARPSQAQRDEFRRRYATAARAVHGYLVPQNFDRIAKVPFDQLFVPACVFTGDSSDFATDAQDWLEETRHVVVLGDPGGGKSTVLQAFLLNNLDSPRQAFHVVLKDYAAYKGASVSILEWIGMQLKERYQLETDPALVEWLLTAGEAVVLLDGLDELLEVSDRRRIAEGVDAFCATHPAAKVVVSSRRVGYYEAPLAPDVFELGYLAPFEEEQIETYVSKFFALDESLLSSQRKQIITAFLEESSLVDDLRVNPLLLGLMCNIYRAEGYIPKNRPDVYEKCARMLFERWDRSRDIRVPLPFEEHLNPAMRFVAHWMYSDAQRQAGVTEHELVAAVADYLLGRRYDDRDAAIAAAQAFVEYCRGRAWVLSEIGANEDEALFQFTHRTFLEYFTAHHLLSLHPSMKQLLTALLPRLRRAEWDVIAHLAVHMRSRTEQDGAETAFSVLLKKTESAGASSRRNLLHFCARLLESVVPPPLMVRQLTRIVLEEQVLVKRSNNAADSGSSLTALLKCSEENRVAVASELRRIASSIDSKSPVHISILTHLSVLEDSRRAQFWASLSQEFIWDLATDLESLGLVEPWAATTLFYSGWSLDRAFSGARHSWVKQTSEIPGTLVSYIAPIGWLLRRALWGQETTSVGRDVSGDLDTLAAWWELDVDEATVVGSIANTLIPPRPGEEANVPELSHRAQLAVGIMLLGSIAARRTRTLIERIAEQEPRWQWLMQAIEARDNRSPFSLNQDGSPLAELIEAWVRHEVILKVT